MEIARTHFFRHRERQTDLELCVRVLLHYHGIEAGTLRAVGTTMLDAFNLLSDAGLDVHGYEGSVSTLPSVIGPSMLHVQAADGESRFVICFGYESGMFVIGEPGCGILLHSARDLARRWTSRALLVVDRRREADAGRYKPFGVSLTPFGRTRTLACASRTKARHILSKDETEALLVARAFRTLEGLEAGIYAHAVQGGRSAAGTVTASSLTTWIDDGLLVSESALRDEVLGLRTVEGGGPNPDRCVTTIGFPTHERTGALVRALRAYLTCVRHHDLHPRFLISGTTEPARRGEVRRHIEMLRHEFSADIVFLDAHAKRRLAACIAAETGCRQDLVRFALLGDERSRSDYGANRNALLLASAGELCILVDDDTMPPDAALQGSDSGIDVSSRFDPNEYWFDGSPLESVPAPEVDFVRLHEDMLGRDPRSVLGDYDRGAVSIEALERPLLEVLKRPEARIGMTFLGHVGDAGTATNGWRLFLEGDSLGRLVEPGYEARIRRRGCVRTVTRRTISDGQFCSAMNLGLDNRKMLPPFMPVGRNEDGVFSAALAACFPTCLRGFREGFVVRHVPPEPRPAFSAPIRFEGLKANDMIAVLIRELGSFRAYGSANSLSRLGQDLVELGSLEQAAFDGWLRSFVLRNVGLAIGEVERAAAIHGTACDALRADLSTYLRSMEVRALLRDGDAPIDLDGTPDERREHFRALVRKYGELLTWWPDLIQSARQVQIGALATATDVGDSER